MDASPDPDGPPTAPERMAVFLPHARLFLDYAGLVTPAAGDRRAFVPLGEDLASDLGACLILAAQGVAWGLMHLDADFSVAEWTRDPKLSSMLPGYIGFRGAFRCVAMRWGFVSVEKASDAGRPIRVLTIGEGGIRFPLVVEHSEWILMGRGLDVMERAAAREFLPGAAERLVLTDRGVKRFEPHPADRIKVDLGRNTVAVDGGEPEAVEPGVAAFIHEVVQARGRPVTFAAMQLAHPDADLKAPSTRYFDKIPGAARGLIGSGKEGYRVL